VSSEVSSSTNLSFSSSGSNISGGHIMTKDRDKGWSSERVAATSSGQSLLSLVFLLLRCAFIRTWQQKQQQQQKKHTLPSAWFSSSIFCCAVETRFFIVKTTTRTYVRLYNQMIGDLVPQTSTMEFVVRREDVVYKKKTKWIE
jgi:hypothetical protein